jgi:hypothetical protein
MANRYTHQFNASYKPQMKQIEGFVSVGTGGQVNFPDAYPVFPTATGPTGVAGQTGVPRFLQPGQATAGVPTGWVGGFSGLVGLIGAGVAGVQRVATGAYVVQLSDDYVSLNSVQVDLLSATAMDWSVVDHTVGLGNSIATGGVTGWLGAGLNPKNRIFIQFFSASSPSYAADIVPGGGFWLDLRLKDSTSGTQ